MFSDLIRCELVWDGSDEVQIPSVFLPPAPGQMEGTAHERLGEISARMCYDSLGVDPVTKKVKGRSSEQMHTHLLEVDNTSVYEHCVFTVRLEGLDPEIYACQLLNRPGVWAEIRDGGVEITLNHRSVLEWEEWNTSFSRRYQYTGGEIAQKIRNYARQLAPRLYPGESPLSVGSQVTLTPKMHDLNPHQAWVSLYLSMSRGCCYDSETEVLTEGGWKRWPDVIGDEKFATLNLETNQLEYHHCSSLIRENYKGLMYRVASECVDLMVTPNHRMVVKTYNPRAEVEGRRNFGIMEAKDIVGKRLQYKRTSEWVGESPEFFDIEDFHNSVSVRSQEGDPRWRLYTSSGSKVPALWFAKFIGYWLAEGWLDHSRDSGYMTVLSQNIDGDAWGDIIETVTHLGFPFTYKSNGDSEKNKVIKISGGRSLYEYLLPYTGAENKGIPAELKGWSPEYQRTLIKSYLQGDGSFAERAAIGEGHTVSKKLADDLQEAALKAGWSASIRISDRRGEERTGKWSHIKSRRINYIVGFAERRNSEPLVNHNGKQNDSWVDYDGMIYCVTVPNGTLYVRRNGKPCWSGNSHEQVRHKFCTAVSQRSSRFCDEDGSPYVTHPLESFYMQTCDDEIEKSLVKDKILDSVTADGEAYRALNNALDKFLRDRGVSGTNARKQARGTARGYLGNALHTEMVFSASVHQWRWQLDQRASVFADGEIRWLYAGHVLRELKKSQYGHFFQHLTTAPSPDGIGLVVVPA